MYDKLEYIYMGLLTGRHHNKHYDIAHNIEKSFLGQCLYLESSLSMTKIEDIVQEENRRISSERFTYHQPAA